METRLVVTTHLTSSTLRMLLFELYFYNIARMLNDLGDYGLVPSTHLSQDPLRKIDDSSIHPVLPEDTGSSAKGWHIGLDHTESAMYRPEEEEYHEEVVQGPEALEVRLAGLLSRCKSYGHETSEHNIARKTRTSCDVR